MPSIDLSETTIAHMLANNAAIITELRRQNDALEKECDEFADAWQESCNEVRNLKQLNSSLLREVQAHRRALADIRQRIVNGETLTVGLAEPIRPIESAEEILEETGNRRQSSMFP